LPAPAQADSAVRHPMPTKRECLIFVPHLYKYLYTIVESGGP
jgi:hypothetical protein